MTTNEADRRQMLNRTKWVSIVVVVLCGILAFIFAKNSLFWLWFMIGTAAMLVSTAARLQLRKQN